MSRPRPAAVLSVMVVAVFGMFPTAALSFASSAAGSESAGAHGRVAVEALGESVPMLTAVPSSLSCGGLAALRPGPADGWATPAGAPATGPSDYYAIELVPTGRVRGTRLSKGLAYTTAAASPFFGVALADGGEYLHDLDIRAEGLKPIEDGAYVAWVTDTNLQEVVRLGALDENLHVMGQADWNKFLVVVTLEDSDAPAERWQGPVIMRGMSRSGRMHTMAGHGPFQAEPCATYGFR